MFTVRARLSLGRIFQNFLKTANVKQPTYSLTTLNTVIRPDNSTWFRPGRVISQFSVGPKQCFASAVQTRSIMATTAIQEFLSKHVHLEDNVSGDYDSIIVVGTSICSKSLGKAEILADTLSALKNKDAEFEKTLTFTVFNDVRVIYAPTGPLNRDEDDIRVFSSATIKGLKRALSSGAKKPLVVLPKTFAPFTEFNVDAAVVLAALEAIYVPLEIREDVPDKKKKIDRIGFVNFNGDSKRLRYLLSIEAGRVACRDIGGSDPERMSAPKVEEYVEALFKDSDVKVEVVSDREQLLAKYPCFAAVDRCASHIKRHNARMIWLEYKNGNPELSLALVGKGVTYDTGGADVKVGGIMTGMHRDKCGAASVAGFFHTLALAKPKNIHVIGALCMVRNSIGADSYVTDEIITSRAGVRVRIGNTDAEGRMAMVDALAEVKERIIKSGVESAAQLHTIATLTGHAKSAVGQPYTITMDNGPARAVQSSQVLQKAGDEIGDLLEVSTIRKEDFDGVKGESEYEDVLQCYNIAKGGKPRGHQIGAAFLIRVAGLDKHGKDSEKSIAYTHLDIAASAGPYPGIPSGSPIPALAQKYILQRI